MKIDDILTLTKAGFTKEEILSLVQGSPSTSASPDQAAAPTPAAAPALEKAEEKHKTEEPAKNENQDISKIIEEKIGEVFKPFETLYNNIAMKANMPTIGNIQPKGIDDIVNDFFTK